MVDRLEDNAITELKAIRQEIAIALPKLAEGTRMSAEMVGIQMAAGKYQLAFKCAALDAANIADVITMLMGRIERAAFNAYGIRPEPSEIPEQFIHRIDLLMKAS
jgi:hypothetical protein